MSVRVIVCVMIVLCLNVSATRAGVFWDACGYFQGRADSGEGNTVFRQYLSQECHEALAAFEAAPADTEARRMAGSVLQAMQEFREVLEAIPLDRLARTYPRHMLHSAPSLLRRPVSASGEVLIARVIGVTPRLSEWASWRMSQR